MFSAVFLLNTRFLLMNNSGFNVKLMTEVQHLDSHCGDKLVGYVQNVVWHYLAKIINALLAVYVTPEPLNIQ